MDVGRNDKCFTVDVCRCQIVVHTVHRQYVRIVPMAYVKMSQRNYGEEFATNQNELMFLLETFTSSKICLTEKPCCD